MSQTMNEMKPGNGETIDSVLGRFFRAEMPHPWPECEANAQARQTPPPMQLASRWQTQSAGRLALAASVVLFFLGYITLAGFFPPSKQNAPQEGGPGLANNPGKSQQLHNPLKKTK